ncbi:MAG: hypothetical protein JWP57_4304 [Spirosoma sp.]|nr:hypothetical protein [Spirosoma sp.]
MIPLIPYWRISFNSPLSRQQVLSELAATHDFVSTDQRIFQPIEDTLTPSEFQVEPFITYRNSFLLRIYGRVFPTETGCQIQLVMTLVPFAWIFILGAASMFAPIVLAIFRELIATGEFGNPRV